MTKEIFSSWLESHILKGRVNNPNIEVGDYTYYSGYYHDKEFEDTCVCYLLGDKSTVSYSDILDKEILIDKLKIGKFCSIGSGAKFILAGNQGHHKDWISTYPFFYQGFDNAKDGFITSGDTVIGSDVWLGIECMIMPGVKIGHGAIIGSRSVVTKDVEPYSIVGGNPAKLIRKRFSDEQISMLLSLSWWDWDIEKIKSVIPELCSDNIKEFYDKYNVHKD